MTITTPLEILGLALAISGAIAGVYIIVEQLSKSTIYTVFLIVIPIFVRAFFPNDVAIIVVYYSGQSESIYQLEYCVYLLCSDTSSFRIVCGILVVSGIGIIGNIQYRNDMVDCLVHPHICESYGISNNAIRRGNKVSRPTTRC